MIEDSVTPSPSRPLGERTPPPLTRSLQGSGRGRKLSFPARNRNPPFEVLAAATGRKLRERDLRPRQARDSGQLESSRANPGSLTCDKIPMGEPGLRSQSWHASLQPIRGPSGAAPPTTHTHAPPVGADPGRPAAGL